jgi:integrase
LASSPWAYTGARLGELAPLTVQDIETDESTRIASIRFREDEEQGRHLKTISSRRLVPIHPKLKTLGFLDFVSERRDTDGEDGRLFPLLKRGPKGGYGEIWSKWFGRYIRSHGITDKASVFHSFRHGFKDALRSAGVSEEVHDALTGHAGTGGVGKEIIRRGAVGAPSKRLQPFQDIASQRVTDGRKIDVEVKPRQSIRLVKRSRKRPDDIEDFFFGKANKRAAQ